MTWHHLQELRFLDFWIKEIFKKMTDHIRETINHWSSNSLSKQLQFWCKSHGVFLGDNHKTRPFTERLWNDVQKKKKRRFLWPSSCTSNWEPHLMPKDPLAPSNPRRYRRMAGRKSDPQRTVWKWCLAKKDWTVELAVRLCTSGRHLPYAGILPRLLVPKTPCFSLAKVV